MPLLALGLNHQTAPLSLRERVAFPSAGNSEALAELLAIPGVDEAALLSTCNRTELYCSVDATALDAPAAWLARHHHIAQHELDAYLYRYLDADAARHLFRVATGLDSMVLGEPQILGQVKDAYHSARSAGALRPALERLFQHGFAVAKRVRSSTAIGAHPVSVAFAAVRLAQQVFAELDKATVLLIGTGETIELAARHLLERKARRLLVANRTVEHAQALAARIGGYALPLAELDRHLAEADIVISATAAREPVLGRETVANALRQRRRRPMFLLDLAVPRDIAADVATLEDVYLYTIDDLDQVIEENRRSRREAAGQAEAMIDLQVEHFMDWWRGSFRQDTLLRLRARGGELRDEVSARARQMLAHGRSPEEALDYLAHALTNKLLHVPTARLRQAAQRGDAELLGAAARLFDDDGSDAADTDLGTRDSDDAEHSPQA